MKFKSLRYVTTFALILALAVMMLGAYTRLTNAGLGCPDWPGCYGRMVLPSMADELSQAQSQYPDSPIEAGKAWTEMAHRYAAGTLAVLILFIVMSVLVFRSNASPHPPYGHLLPQGEKEIRKKFLGRENRISRKMPLILTGLVVFQALLGMWTVTLKLLPVVVMGHLLGGALIFVSLCYFRWQLSDIRGQNLAQWRFWIGLGLVIVFSQIALGGWVSSNYAGIACIGFPTCNGQWLPTLNFSQGFYLFSPVGANYQGGLLDNNARVTIQFIHRLGALITAGYVCLLSVLILIRVNEKSIRSIAVFALVIVAVQFTLGIMNVVYLLPLWVAVAHNGGAALLLGIMVSMFYLARGDAVHADQ